ncbi:MAG: benzoate/H(+) symporter BenE family transporter, partial [Pseudomonadota bacterium]|nr:benzoate/H(+) symporter BenE family transporter [Pseudomonadota bacterium]
PALEHLSFAEVIGAFYITGLLLLILGLSGWLKKIMAVLPMPIIMGMVAGVFLQFALDWIIAMGTFPAIAIPMTIVFVLLSFKPEISNRFPPMIGVLLVGSIAVYATGTFEASDKIEWVFVPPKVYQPVFSFRAIIELVLPLAVTVLAAQNAQGIAILRANQQNPPVNIITAVCGLGSLIVALFGCVSTCLTGPVNAILSSGGPKEKQYTAAIIICILAIIFGVQAPLFINLMLATPPAFISTLAGLALIRVLQNSFVVSFGGSFTLGALISFLVTILDQSIFGIGAPFWGLVLGVFTSWLLENRDFSEG